MRRFFGALLTIALLLSLAPITLAVKDNSDADYAKGGKVYAVNETKTTASDSIAGAGASKTIATGRAHAAAIDENGSLWTWGDNSYGQLGNGGGGNATYTGYAGVTYYYQTVPTKIMDDVVMVDAYDNSTAAIKSDGSLWIWGEYNEYEYDDNGDFRVADLRLTRNVPTKIMDDVKMVSIGGTCGGAAIKNDDSLWVWDWIPGGRNAKPTKIMDNVLSVVTGEDDSGGFYSCIAVIKSDKSLWVWGASNFPQMSSSPEKIADNVESVYMCVSGAGDYNVVSTIGFIKTDHTFWVVGGGGDYGMNELRRITSPVKLADDVASASVAYYKGYNEYTKYIGDIALLKTDGSVWSGFTSWEYDENSGLNTYTEFTKVGDGFAELSQSESNGYFAVAAKTDGTLWSWGWLRYGNLGNGDVGDVTDEYGTVYQTVPAQIPNFKVKIPIEYLYDTPDPGEDVGDLPEYTAENVTSEATAVEAVEGLAEAMTTEQKESATGIDLATLLAETAAAKAASQAVTGKEIIINKANVTPLAEKAGSAVDAVDVALVSGGITTARYLSNTVILTSTETGEITIKIDPDILETEVDKVRVETPNYALTFKIADIEEDLTDIVTIKASSVGTTVSGGATARMGATLMRTLAPTDKPTSVKLDVQNGKLKGPVTISLPDDDGDDSGDTTVSKDDGSAVSSKYNPATSTMDGKVTESGTYTVTTNSKDFTDISSKSQEMQTAIKYLASKGIINGTSETTFSPDGEITRAEVAALLVRSLGKLDASAKSTFDDVKTSDWFYAAAASSAKCGYIKGYDDNTFKGKNQILKQETVAVVSHVLQAEMGYKLPTDTAKYLSKYSDTLPNWAKSDIALATRENLIVYRVDGTFSGSKTITRGDAAIILYRMFQKIW